MKLKRTNSADPDFVALVADLDKYLAEVDGDEHDYYAQFNGIDKIANVVVAYEAEEAVGCGAFKPYSDSIAEIKRMFTKPEHRGKKIGALILAELESWANELGYTECILETGQKTESRRAALSEFRLRGDPKLRSVCRRREQHLHEEVDSNAPRGRRLNL